MVRTPLVLCAMSNAALPSFSASPVPETSILTPSRMIFAETPYATKIVSVVGVVLSMLLIVIVLPERIESTPLS